mgnify:CR=1 FL=1
MSWQVECYSGHTYAQEPRALTHEGCRYHVVEVERRWLTPHGPRFRVRTETGERFLLMYDTTTDSWQVKRLAARPPNIAASDLAGTTGQQTGI